MDGTSDEQNVIKGQYNGKYQRKQITSPRVTRILEQIKGIKKYTRRERQDAIEEFLR